jgi:hypothetical protein
MKGYLAMMNHTNSLIYELLARVREDRHKLRGSRQECMRPRAGEDGVCISYNEMMSIYPGVSKKYTACR